MNVKRNESLEIPRLFAPPKHLLVELRNLEYVEEAPFSPIRERVLVLLAPFQALNLLLLCYPNPFVSQPLNVCISLN
jgi:hypothetical protein